MYKLTFQEWMTAVDSVIEEVMGGLTSADLPDCCYRDWYSAGKSAKSAANKAMRIAKCEE